MDNQNPQDPNQGGMGGGMPVDPNQPAPAPVAEPVAEQPAPEAPAAETPQPQPTPAAPEMGGDQGGQNPTGGAPVV